MRVLLVLWLTGCGRIAFDPLRDGDAALGRDGQQTAVDAAFPNANRVFVTSGAPVGGMLGGLAGADALCEQEARDAGLQGTFVAFLSTTTTNAIDRLAGSRGWVRTDGEPVLDTAADLTVARVFNVIDRDASGAMIHAAVWTGSSNQGIASGFGTCGGWIDTVPNGAVGNSGSGQPAMLATSVLNCSQTAHVLCFGLGASETVAPIPTTGRTLFVTSAGRSGPGLGGLDGPCQTEAMTAGLNATFLAAVATTTTTIASRFATDSRPWVRPDGVRVADGGNALFDGTERRSLVDQHADGTYTMATLFWSGAASAQVTGTAANTCSDWSSQMSGNPGLLGAGNSAAAAEFWIGGGMLACNLAQPILCLEQ